MPSIFSFTSPSAKRGKHPKSSRSVSGPLTPEQRGTPPAESPSRVGEFGDLAPPPPLSKPALSQTAHLLTPPYSPNSPQQATLILPPKYSFAPTRIPPRRADLISSGEEGSVPPSYGFLGGIGARVTLGVEDVSDLLHDVGDELMRRGLPVPMLFSSQALELNQIRTKHLIQTYLDTLTQPSTQRSNAFRQDILYAKEHELAWLLRWALARLIRTREGMREVLHGMIEWELYEEWRGREKSANYRSDAYPYLSVLVSAELYDKLLTPLFHLLSRFAAHSHLSGLTPHTLASLFAPLVFHVPATSPAIIAHRQYVRAASATEHLLLAYIRSSGRRDGLGITDLPTRLAAWVKGYPTMVARDEELARGGPRKGARVVRCERASRIVRAYSRDLVVTAELWAQEMINQHKMANLNQSQNKHDQNPDENRNRTPQWDAWDRVILDKRGEVGRPIFSSAWRRRMVVPETLPLPASSFGHSGRGVAMTTYGTAERPGSGRREKEGRKPRDGEGGDEDGAKWGSVAGKEWSMFEQGGFDVPELRGSTDLNGRLEFDLTESAKMTIAERRRTMDWTEFASPNGGFSRTDPLLATSLVFAEPISDSITHWPETRDDLRKRLHKSQKDAVPFEFDTSLKVGLQIQDLEGVDGGDVAPLVAGMDDKGRVYFEEAFVDFWADLVLGAGWGEREELTFKEANWALIEYKARPSRTDPSMLISPLSDPDPRTSTMYFLFEERVPLEYQLAIANPQQKKTLGSLFSPRRKRTPPTKPNESLRRTLGSGGGGWLDSDFDRMLLRRTQTKRITLGKAQHTVMHFMDAPSDSQSHAQSNAPIRNSSGLFDVRSDHSGNSRIPPRSQSLSRMSADDPNISEGKANFFSKGLRGDRTQGGRTTKRNGAQEAGRIGRKRAGQAEQEVEYEIASASGLSSGSNGDSPGRHNANGNGNKTGHTRGNGSNLRKEEDKWMDILIANGAKKMERRGALLPPPPDGRSKGLPSSPYPDRSALPSSPAPATQTMTPLRAVSLTAASRKAVPLVTTPHPATSQTVPAQVASPPPSSQQATQVITIFIPSQPGPSSDDNAPNSAAFAVEQPRSPPLMHGRNRDYASIHSPGSTAGLQLEEYDSTHTNTTLASISPSDVDFDPYASPLRRRHQYTRNDGTDTGMGTGVGVGVVSGVVGIHGSRSESLTGILSPTPQRDAPNLIDSYYEHHADQSLLPEQPDHRDLLDRPDLLDQPDMQDQPDLLRNPDAVGRIGEVAMLDAPEHIHIQEPRRDSTLSTISTDYPPSHDEDEQDLDADGDMSVLQPPNIGWKFDMTPGREPSPARYKHGEPLQNVGEVPEEEL